jgi:hypothetical protein
MELRCSESTNTEIRNPEQEEKGTKLFCKHKISKSENKNPTPSGLFFRFVLDIRISSFSIHQIEFTVSGSD